MFCRPTWLFVIVGSLAMPAGLRAQESKPATGATQPDGNMMKRYT